MKTLFYSSFIVMIMIKLHNHLMAEIESPPKLKGAFRPGSGGAVALKTPKFGSSGSDVNAVIETGRGTKQEVVFGFLRLWLRLWRERHRLGT